LKRSLKSEQKLEMNSTDFMRAAGGRKVKFSFSFALHNGKVQNLESAPPLGRDLVDALQDDKISSQFVKTNHLEFTMNKNFELLIKNTTPAPAEGQVEEGGESSGEEANDTIVETTPAENKAEK